MTGLRPGRIDDAPQGDPPFIMSGVLVEFTDGNHPTSVWYVLDQLIPLDD